MVKLEYLWAIMVGLGIGGLVAASFIWWLTRGLP